MKPFKHEALGTEPYRQPINQKLKGNANERDVAKVLSDWTGARFARTPMSGGLHWDHESVSGDVVCVTRHFDFIFSVETKHYASWHVTPILRENSAIFPVFDQALNDSLDVGKYPMLILRENGMPKMEYYIFLNVARRYIEQCCDIIAEADHLFGVYSTDFFKNVTYDGLKEYIYGR